MAPGAVSREAGPPPNSGVLGARAALRVGRVYEVWGIEEGAGLDKAVPAGVFRASRGVTVVPFELPIQPRMSFGVTDEPGPAGSRSPTSKPVLVGKSTSRA